MEILESSRSRDTGLPILPAPRAEGCLVHRARADTPALEVTVIDGIDLDGIEERRAQYALDRARTTQIGRYAYAPGKGYRVGFWRRLARRLVGWL